MTKPDRFGGSLSPLEAFLNERKMRQGCNREFAKYKSDAEPLINAALQLADWSEEDDPMQDHYGRLYENLMEEAAKYRSES